MGQREPEDIGRASVRLRSGCAGHANLISLYTGGVLTPYAGIMTGR